MKGLPPDPPKGPCVPNRPANVNRGCLLYEMFCLLEEHTFICNECQCNYPTVVRGAFDLCDVLSTAKGEFDAFFGMASVIDCWSITSRVRDLAALLANGQSDQDRMLHYTLPVRI